MFSIGYAVFAVSLSGIAYYEMHNQKKLQRHIIKEGSELERVTEEPELYKMKANNFHLAFHELRHASTILLMSETLSDDRDKLFNLSLQASLSELAYYFSCIRADLCYTIIVR